MSAYDNVGHFKSSTASLGIHQHHLHSQQMSHRAAQAARQRRWRVLLSIGLLLPALAAIIGIVAWTISIEVANGSAQSEAVAQASALVGGQQRRSLHPNQLTGEQAKFQHHFRRRPQEPKAAEDASLRRRNVQESAGQAEGAAESPAEPATGGKSESAGAAQKAPIGQNDKQSAAILLTNLEQVEALERHLDEQESSSEQPKIHDGFSEEPSEQRRVAKSRKQHKSSVWPHEDKAKRLAAKTSAHKESGARKGALMRQVESPAVSSRKMSISRVAAKQEPAAKGLKLDSRYVIVPAAEQQEEPAAEQELLELTEEPSTLPATSTQPPSTTSEQPSEAPRAANGEDEAGTTEQSATESPAATTTTSSRDELSQFEAIASAISSSLSAAAATDEARRPQEPPEGDTGALPNVGGPADARAEQRRARTAGQHVADVIDHIVDQRRRQQPLGQLASPRGPQIVVVAPVGGGEGAMRARSLTKSSDIDTKSGGGRKSGNISAPAKQQSKKEALVEKQRRTKKPAATKSAPLGARLLGVQPTGAATPSETRFSERVEVIEDDDSSAFLFKEPQRTEAAEQSDGRLDSRSDLSPQAEEPEEPGSHNDDRLVDSQSSIHVASRPSQPRSRTPRHELAASRQLERYAPLPVEPVKRSQDNGPKLYSAEQLIRDAVIKAKTRPAPPRSSGQNSTQAPPANQPQPPQPSQPQPQPPPQPEQKARQPGHQVKVAPTTLRPHQPHQPHQADQTSRQQQLFQAESQQAFGSDIQPVRVPLFMQQANQQQMQAEQTYQQQRLAAEQSQVQPARPNEAGQPMQLPQFADQEYNVPAHMAESVIQDLQRSPVGLLNGRPTLLNPMGFQQQQPTAMMAEASHPQMTYHQLVSQQQQQQQANQMYQQQQRLPVGFPPMQHLYRTQVGNQQVLANREGADREPIAIKAPKGLVHPVAQMALRHLFSSLAGQQAAAEQQAQRQDGKEAAMQAPASQPDASGRSMRSLQPDAGPLAAQTDPLEVQESYSGPQPAYHMGGEQYPSGGHDKKSKGITFHFGGGPIGGGTQLITSPMGIFKHLMIPLMPNPRVNLNGKVVFGVVLEKSTAIGEPKKKYKFWG